MNKFFTLLLAILCSVTTCLAQWNVVFPGPGLIWGLKMTFVDANLGYMVGTNAFPNGQAKIARTTNGGQSWTSVYALPPAITPSLLTMNDIQVLDQNIAFACGGYVDPIKGIIVKSVNGGITWDTLAHDLVGESKFLAVHFFNATNGLIAGNGLWRTTNGGLNWLPVTLPAGVVDLRDLHFVNATTGFAVGNTTSTLIRTTDGGVTWTSVTLPTTEVTNEVEFFDATRGVLACDNGTILYTTNGGTTWTAGTNAEPDLSDVICVEMTSATAGFAGTVNGNILHTSNGGASWTVNVDIPASNGAFLLASIYDIEFPTAQVGYTSGSILGAYFKTTNAGGVVGISELRREELRMSPNPAVDFIRYDTQDVHALQLFSAEGCLIEEQQGVQLRGLLDVSKLSNGAYILKVIGRNTLREGLFIKE